MQYIGKLNKENIGEYKDKLITLEVVLTDERKAHILQKHANDYNLIINNINKIVLNPQEVLKDSKNDNLNVVIKLNVINNNMHPKNSIMTAWIIRNSNLIKLREKNKIIYKKE